LHFTNNIVYLISLTTKKSLEEMTKVYSALTNPRLW